MFPVNLQIKKFIWHSIKINFKGLAFKYFLIQNENARLDNRPKFICSIIVKECFLVTGIYWCFKQWIVITS